VRRGLPARLAVNLAVFFVGSAAVTYFGFVEFLAPSASQALTIKAYFVDAAGVLPRFPVTYEGVDVGTVTSVALQGDRAIVTMSVGRAYPIPANVAARIGVANVVGQQQVELVDQGPPKGRLRDGQVVPVSADPVPASLGQVVQLTTKLLSSLPPSDLNTVFAELAKAVAGNESNIRSLIASSSAFSKEFLAYQRAFENLLKQSPPFLDELSKLSSQIKDSLSATAATLAVLGAREADIADLFSQGTRLGQLGTALLSSQLPNLGCVVRDLAAVTRNAAEEQVMRDLEQTLVLSNQFFSELTSTTQLGPAPNVRGQGPGQVYYLRTRLILPPAPPVPDSYPAGMPLLPTKPGGPCITPFGPGAPAPSQPDFKPYGRTGSVLPPEGSS
jgi:virulence factor Mce-like protein